MSAQLKIEEAAFFLELLDAVSQRKRPLTNSGSTKKEVSFLFSAILNAFYSAMAIMRDEENINVSTLRAENPEIYERAKNGGERAKTVHVSHTLPAHAGYIPPKGGVHFNFRKAPLLIQESSKTNLNLGP